MQVEGVAASYLDLHLTTHEPDDIRCIELGWEKIKKPVNTAFYGPHVFISLDSLSPWQDNSRTGLSVT